MGLTVNNLCRRCFADSGRWFGVSNTIADGSTATGIIVTRAADSNMGADITTQFAPGVFTIAGGLLFGFSLVPGLPTRPFFILALASLLIGFRGRRRETVQQQATLQAEQMAAAQAQEGRAESVVNLLAVDPLEIELGFGLIALADAAQGSELSERINMIRRQFVLDLGFIVPIIRIRDNIQLQPNTYVVKVKGVPVGEGELMLDHLMAMNPGSATANIAGIATKEPAFGLPAWWIREEERERAEMLGYTVLDPATVLATHLTELIRAYAPDLLGRQQVQQLLDHVREYAPAVVEEVVPDLLLWSSTESVGQFAARGAYSGHGDFWRR